MQLWLAVADNLLANEVLQSRVAGSCAHPVDRLVHRVMRYQLSEVDRLPLDPTPLDAAVDDSPRRTHALRASCQKCGSDAGYIETRGNQDCVFCVGCMTFQYNAPRLETGRRVRSLSTRPGITPSQRARILDAFSHSCISCGRRAPAVVLTLEHIISRENAERFEMLDALIDSEWNLAPMCEECNSGHRWLNAPSLELMYRALQMRALAGQIDDHNASRRRADRDRM